MHLVAGGPIAVADRHDTIGGALDIYRNEEMLALNWDGFVGRPLVNDPTLEASQVWTGRMSNGDTIVALFDRESTPRLRSIALVDLDVSGEVTVRDMWQRAPLGSTDRIEVTLAPHASLVLRVSPGRVVPTGEPGTAWVVASQPGDGTWCAAVPVVGSFAVSGGR